MVHISPEEHDLFVKALRFLYGERIAQIGWEGDLTPVRRQPESPEEPRSA